MAGLTDDELDELVPDDDPEVVAGLARLSVLRVLEQIENDGARP